MGAPWLAHVARARPPRGRAAVDSASSPFARQSAMDRPIQRRWWRRRPYQAAIAALLVFAAVGGVVLLPSAGVVRVERQSVNIGVVTYARFDDYLPLRGDIAPLDTVFVTAEEGGRVEATFATDGQRMAKGEPIARLYNSALVLQIKARETEISARLNDVSNQRLNLKKNTDLAAQSLADAYYLLHKAEREYGQRKTLRDGGYLNDQGLKPYTDELQYQRQRVATLQASQKSDGRFYEAQQAQLQRIESDLAGNLAEVRKGQDALTLTAPIAGRLTNFNPLLGQTLRPGEALGQIDGEGAYKVKAQVDEFYLPRLRQGLGATAAVHGQSVALTVSKVFAQVSNGRVNIELAFKDAIPDGVKRGEAVDLRLSLGDSSRALLAPNGSWVNDTGATSAFVVSADGKRAIRRGIQAGRKNPEFVEITGGLKAGDRILTSGLPPQVNAREILIRGAERE